MDSDVSFFPIFICLFFSAFFSGIEIAFLSADKLRLEIQQKTISFTNKIITKFYQNTSQFISTIIVGNTIALVVFGIYMTELFDPVIRIYLPQSFVNQPVVLIVQTFLSTLIVLFTAEFFPKTFFMANPNKMLAVFAIPMNIIYQLSYPFIITVVWISKFIITKILSQKIEDDQPVFKLTDLNDYIKNTLDSGNIDTSKIFNNALEFKSVKIRECMIPRTDIVAVDIDDDIRQLKQAFIETGYSKVLVYKSSIDDMIGYCHAIEMFKNPKKIENILTPLIIVPETMLANELMINFIAENKSMALVVDEYGGTSGIVTIEDIIEEILGEIHDEHDEDDWVEKKLSNNSFLFSARLEIDYLNDKYGWSLPKGDYETLGGFIISLIEDIPNVGSIIRFKSFVFEIQATQDSRIDTIKVNVENS